MITTTLNRIRQHKPCQSGWEKLLSFLNKTQADDEPLSLLTILESNGVDDCLWAFRCTDDNESIYQHIAADFAESVLHIYEEKYPQDNRPRLAIKAARDYAHGLIDDAAAGAAGAAGAAAGAAGDAARAAAGAAARAAAGAADLAAAGAAARAARAAAGAADLAAAGAAARALEKQKQYDIIHKYLSL